MAEAEAVLLTRFTKAGDAEALAEIVRRHAGLVYAAALRILADVDTASDVAQETFLQLTKDAHRVRGSLPGWLHRVATHKAIDQMRRDSSRRRREAEYALGQPRAVVDWKDVSPYVDEELSKLDAGIRDTLVAHFLEGRTTRQIAAAQGVSQATISRRVDAGVARLRSALRRRGILVAAGALSALLSENAAQAAPPALMAELGKIALIGGHAAAVSGSAWTAQALASGLLTGVKANVVALAAVAVIGAGSVVTYRNATRPRPSENTVITRSATRRMSSRVVSSPALSSASSRSRPAGRTCPSEAAQRWNELISLGRAQAGYPSNRGTSPQEPLLEAEEPMPRVTAGYGLGGAASAGSSGSTTQRNATVQTSGGMGGYYYFASTPPSRDANDSDDDGSDQ